MIKKKNLSYCFYYLFIFIVLFVFFSQVHPLLPFDTDDWMYNGLARPPYPSFSRWNPTKLLPECLQSLTALVAAFFVAPILGDYIHALVISNAFVISLFIIGYFYSVQKLVECRFKISQLSGFCLITVFALLHFLALKTNLTNNEHLFYSRDVTCFYHYLVPNTLCASLVMWLMCHDIKSIKNNVTLSIVLFVTFLALFSNLYSTVMLIAYVGAVLLLDLWEINKKENEWLKKYIKNNAYYLIVILIWLVIQYFEANGNRATSYGYMFVPFKDSLEETVKYFIFHSHFNGWFMAFTIAVIVCAKIYNFQKDNHNPLHIGKKQIIIILAMILSIFYLILLSSRVFPFYILKGDVIFSYIFFYFLLVALCMGYLSKRIRIARLLYPFLIFFFLFMLNTEENTFKDLQYWNGTDLQTCEQFDRDIINQVKAAEAMGKDTITIYVHNYNEGSNWPQNLDFGQYIGLTLQKHGIIKRKIVTIYERMPAELDTQK